MITALAWIPRGVTPKKLLPSSTNDEEVERYLQILNNEEKKENPPPEQQETISEEDAEIIKKYNLDKYDDDDDDDEENEGAGFQEDYVTEDTYLVAQPNQEEEDNDDDDIRNSDFLLIVGKYGEEVPTLEVHLFDDTQETLFVHHELLLPSFPLSIRWLDFEPSSGKNGSFAAVSSMRPEIEIWNLNIEDPICPAAILQFHSDSVPGLSWNLNQRSALLSASIDHMAAIWSLQTLETAATFDVGSECKAAEWCPTNATLFSIASSGGVYTYDARTGPAFAALEGTSIECLVWSGDGNQYITSLTSGEVAAVDIRNPTELLFGFQAHDGPANSVACCMAAPVIATVGDDQLCKIWRADGPQPVQIDEDDLKVGQMFTCMFCPDKPTLLAVGGSENGAALWDIENVINQAAESA